MVQPACAEAVAGHPEKAFRDLQTAAGLGSAFMVTMASDEDLKSVRQGPRVAALIEKAKQLAARGSN